MTNGDPGPETQWQTPASEVPVMRCGALNLSYGQMNYALRIGNWPRLFCVVSRFGDRVRTLPSSRESGEGPPPPCFVQSLGKKEVRSGLQEGLPKPAGRKERGVEAGLRQLARCREKVDLRGLGDYGGAEATHAAMKTPV